MEIIESQNFTKRIVVILSDEEYKEMQWTLIANPIAGKIIKEGKGLRKLRWSIKGSGKSGGIRVIYYYLTGLDKIFMILVYKKSEQGDLTKAQLKILINYVKEGVL